MDIHTLTRTIHELKGKYKSAQERFNLHPSDPYHEGKLTGIYESLNAVEGMLNKELEARDVDC